ncbi:hypothetical protein [Eubacterium oxidoreducens]|uniref:Uncharacterized protein n=1 Tax=Eubacterium oxidoreducens TaxID=1732 RepID=A0A1G6B439_EUBOX|nr:hypothetical protein [Eubacterium oxidoreducens]SDB15362.1 hypothetical protein SAMN02910417_01143 [Eubacterium oxidoreducens]
MKEVFDVYVGFLFIILVSITSMSVITAGVEVREADAYCSAVVEELENSDFNKDVLNACLSQAEENGYEMTIITSDNAGNQNTYTNESGATSTDGVTFAEVVLEYDFSINFLNADSSHTMRGFAS